MSERLPVIGSDNNNWGTVLNRFLEISHNSDGSLNTAATIPAPSPADAGFTETGSANPNLASAAHPGFVQLAGNLGGTAASPTVVSTSLASALPVNQGGTSLATLTSGSVIIGNGTSAPTFVAPGSVGNVLTNVGGAWTSQAPASGTQRTFSYFAG